MTQPRQPCFKLNLRFGVPGISRLVQQTCRTRTRLVTPSVPMGEQGEGMVSDPVEVAVGGAVMFVMGVQEFVKV